MLENNYQINFVETYVIEEVSQMIYDDEKLNEYKKLISELGIKQDNLFIENKSPLPFSPMKKKDQVVFETLCPIKTNYKEFNDTPIPLEILKLIELSVREQYFQEIEIWHDYEKPDPVCIGITGVWYPENNDYQTIRKNPDTDEKWMFKTREEALAEQHKRGWTKHKPLLHDKKYYLIGRWADVKSTMEELQRRAKQRFLLEKKTYLMKQIKQAQRELDDLELEAIEKFGI